MNKIVYHGHHKCASTWIHRILRRMSHHAGWKIATHEAWLGDRDIAALVDGNNVVVNLNSRDSDREATREVPAFHVIRHPRDLLISGYFSHLYSHPTSKWKGLIPHRERLQRLSMEDGIIAEMDFSEHVFQSMREWDYQTPCLELKMEEITRAPYQSFLNILDHAGMLRDTDPRILEIFVGRFRRFLPRFGSHKLTASQVLMDVHRHRFKRESGGRRVGETNVKHHYRSGKPGDWEQYWTPAIETAWNARYRGIERELGYEN